MQLFLLKTCLAFALLREERLNERSRIVFVGALAPSARNYKHKKELLFDAWRVSMYRHKCADLFSHLHNEIALNAALHFLNDHLHVAFYVLDAERLLEDVRVVGSGRHRRDCSQIPKKRTLC